MSYKFVKTKDMEIGKIYYHFSKKFDTAKWIRLINLNDKSTHFHCFSSEYFNHINNDESFNFLIGLEFDDPFKSLMSKLFNMITDGEPYGIISEEFNTTIKIISDVSYLRFNNPRKDFFDENILLEVLDIENFPFKEITSPKLSQRNWIKDWRCKTLSKEDMRELKISSILI
jgi:hypothetical protein